MSPPESEPKPEDRPPQAPSAPAPTPASTAPFLADAMRRDWAPRPRRRLLPLALFLMTCGTTFLAGCFHWLPIFAWSAGLDYAVETVQKYWDVGLIYMAGVMFTLLCHEMGHFVMTVRHRVHASWPYFIPFPMMLTGTMGAVIGMEHSKANRKELFDIGLAGPLAGLVPTVALVAYGISHADYSTGRAVLEYGDPLLATLLIQLLRPDLPEGAQLIVNPYYMAGWVGMLITGLNMMPVSQLDGGHVAYAVLGRGARVLARAFMLAVAAYMVLMNDYTWALMFLLVLFLRIDHPPTSDDTVPLGWFRRTLGLASLLIPVLCFTPTPLRFAM